MDKNKKTYHWNELKDLLPEHHPKESIWDSINSTLDSSSKELNFNKFKDQLPSHEPAPQLWENISKNLDKPSASFVFADYKDELSDHTPSENIWEKIETDLDLGDKVSELPSHNPPENLWHQIENELEDVKGGLSYIKSAILIGISMLFLIGFALMLNQEETTTQEVVEPIMFASNEKIKVEWSDDEDVRLIQEMCQDYMAVCEQPQFKKLETELLELNEHKQELLELVSDYDEESSYGPMLAKIENQKTALMKEMISMI